MTLQRLVFLPCIALSVVAGCKPCDDSCREFVELQFLAIGADGAFASTSYDIRLSSPDASAACVVEVATAPGDAIECSGDAEAYIDDGVAGGSDSGGEPADGRTRIIVRWHVAPDSFELTVRNAESSLVLDNTLTPAWQEQDVEACDGECRSFLREVSIGG